MDLICPSCQKRLTIEDRYAGMVVKCPMCGGMLQAPVLLNTPPVAPPPASVPAPAPPPSVEPLPGPSIPASAPAPMPAIAPSPPTTATPVLDVAEVIPPPSAPPIRPGEYTKSFRFHVRADILEWIPPVCVIAVFLLSFFAWCERIDHWQNLWELAFTARGESIYTFYTIVLMFLALPVSVIVCCLEKRWIPLPEGARPVWPYRALIVGGLIVLPFLLFLGDYVNFQFLPFQAKMSIAMKLAFRIHLVAVIATALQFWLEWRKSTMAPPPRITLRW